MLLALARTTRAFHAFVMPQALRPQPAAPPRAPTSAAAAAAAADVALTLRAERFARVLPLVALRVPAGATEAAHRSLRDLLVAVPRVRPAVKPPAGFAPPDPACGNEALLRGEDARLVLLSHELFGRADLADAPPAARARVEAVLAGLPGGAAGRACAFEVPIGYEHLTMEEVLREVLPPAAVEAAGGHLPVGFEVVGHVAHLNLRDELLPWRFVIGRVLLDKNPALRTVVNKVGAIESEFRTFEMEVLAGEDDTRVEVRHGGATFEFDFRKVYWNSRLQHEHDVLVDKIIAPAAPAAAAAASSVASSASSSSSSSSASSASSSASSSSSPSASSSASSSTSSASSAPAPAAGMVVADMFAGVGPFALPLAMRRRDVALVHANDLNPHSHAAMLHNLRRNRRDVGERVRAYNLDGRDFVRALAARREPVAHYIMNLPNDALAFCDVFVGLFTRARGEDRRAGVLCLGLAPAAADAAQAAAAADASASAGGDGGGGGGGAAGGAPPPAPAPALPLPTVHVYCFSKGDSEEQSADDVVRRLLAVLRLPPLDEGAGAGASEGAGAGAGAGAEAPATDAERRLDGVQHSVASALVRRARRAGAALPGLLVRCVRNVAPGKLMMCASFELPAAVANAPEPSVRGPLDAELRTDRTAQTAETSERAAKRPREEA